MAHNCVPLYEVLIMKYLFKPKVSLIDKTDNIASISDIESEPMLYACDLSTAKQLGGPLTKKILSKIESCSDMDFKRLINENNLYAHIDTKSVMLMPDFYPCIGGWHCDAVPRCNKTMQPVLSLIREDIFHYLCIIPSTSKLSNTEFLINDIETDVNKLHVWKSINSYIEDSFDKVILEATDGGIWKFNQPTIHRGRAAKGQGWRYFFRLTFTTVPPSNKIRNQVQVYTSPDTSW